MELMIGESRSMQEFLTSAAVAGHCGTVSLVKVCDPCFCCWLF